MRILEVTLWSGNKKQIKGQTLEIKNMPFFIKNDLKNRNAKYM